VKNIDEIDWYKEYHVFNELDFMCHYCTLEEWKEFNDRGIGVEDTEFIEKVLKRVNEE